MKRLIRKSVTGLGVLSVLLLLSSRAFAVPIISINPMEIIDPVIGSTVSFDVVLGGDGGPNLFFYQFDVIYDTAELSYIADSITENNGIGSDQRLFTVVSPSPEDGIIRNIQGEFPDLIANGGTGVLATLDFQVVSVISDGIDLIAAFNSQGVETLLYQDFTEPTEIDFVGGQITVIPEPASLLLIGSGLVGLFGVARRKKSE